MKPNEILTNGGALCEWEQNRASDECSLPEFDRAGDASSTLDTVFFALSNTRRRDALQVLGEHDGPIALSKLTDQVTVRENGTSIEAVSRNDRKTVYTSLRQTHLPMLKDAEFVDYDDSMAAISLTSKGDELGAYIDAVPGYHRLWSRYYVGLGVVLLAFVTAVWLDVYPFHLLSGLACAAIAAGALVVSAAVQWYYPRRNG